MSQLSDGDGGAHRLCVPKSIGGTDIPIGARILSVVDCFDALTSDRPYRRALSDEAAIAILLERRGLMYDPVVVDAFIRIRRHVPLVHDVPEEQRDVLAQIARSLQGEPSPPADPVAATQPLQAGDAMLAFVSLARLASGAVTMSDVLALSTSLVRHVVPGGTGAWFLCAGRGERLVVAEAFGPTASALRGMTLRMGEKLTGWVAANRQVIVNSDAALDLGERAARATPALDSCLAVPLAAGQELVGVLSLYASGPNAFTEHHGRLIQMVAPHLAAAIHAAQQHAEPTQSQPARELRLVSPRG